MSSIEFSDDEVSLEEEIEIDIIEDPDELDEDKLEDIDNVDEDEFDNVSDSDDEFKEDEDDDIDILDIKVKKNDIKNDIKKIDKNVTVPFITKYEYPKME